MSDKLPSLKPAQLIRVLEKAGWYIKRQTGSHVILVNEALRKSLPVPMHKRYLKTGTAQGIIRRAGLTAEEVHRLLK
ncbi:MAG: type II toxin-antitoxin system HicA family toxin [Actinomycetota bacterium]|nr:type II toxin-antitoxin system HicA family toxin [Actinomycetota bacterium]